MNTDKKQLFSTNKKQSIISFLKKYTVIAAGTIPYSAGIALFLNPNDLAPGGVTGISILLNRFTGIETGTLILLINIPVILLGIWKFGWKFTMSTVYALVLISALTNCMDPLGAMTGDRLLAAIVGAALVGAGMGIIFKCEATTGGIDIIVKLLRQKYPHLKTGSLFLLLDSIVIAAAGLVFGNIESAIYAAIAVAVTTYTLDTVLYGRDGARLIYIISDYNDAITQKLLHEAGVGVTWLYGAGAFHSRDKRIVMCVADKKKSLKVEEIVKETDGEAFLIITSANEIYGEGYKNIFSEKI